MRFAWKFLFITTVVLCSVSGVIAQDGDAETTETVPKEKSLQNDASPESPPAENAANTATPDESSETTTLPTLPPRAHAGRFAGAMGGIGLDRTLSAHVGVVDTVRLRARIGGFSTDDFPVDGSSNEFIETGLSIGYTPHENAELYFLVTGTSNTNTLGKPELIQTQGDFSLGGKFVEQITPLVSAGAALQLHFISDVGSGGVAWGSTSTEIRGLMSIDLKATENEPIRFNLNLGYYLENADSLDNGLDDEPTLVQEFGLRTARYDRLSLGLGLEVPLDEPIIPFVEYEVVMPILVELGRRSDDSNDYSFFSIPHSVALGARGFVTDNLSVEGIVRFGLSDQPYSGVPATPPWLATMAIGYHLDPTPVTVTESVEPPSEPEPAPALKTFSVAVLDAESNAPIAGAAMAYSSRPELSAQVTGPAGTITSYPMPDGEVLLRVTAKGYLPEESKIVVGGEVASLEIKVKKDPSDRRGKLSLTVQNEAGRGVAASVQFGGNARDISGRTDRKGLYSRELVPGRYPLTINARGFGEVTRNVLITADQTIPLKITLMPLAKPKPVTSGAAGGSTRPSAGLAVVTKKGIRLKRKLSFVRNTAELTADSQRVLRDLARGLNATMAIQRVQIGVHTGGRGSMDDQMKLSRQRAKAIKAYLAKKKVDRKRLRVRGFGATKPLAPPLTKRGRQKNQRVEFRILKVK